MPNLPAALTGPDVAVLAYDGLCTFEFGIAYEVFGLPRPEMGTDWYRARTVAVEPGRLRAAGGLEVAADDDLATLDQADLIIIPGWRRWDAPVPGDLCAALRTAHMRGARIATLCSGVFVLAATGLLDGRMATTHWRYLPMLRERHPAIRIEPDILYVDNGQLLTAAGSAAGIDLCLHIVRSDYGPRAANRVARRLVVPPHRDGGQAQYVERPVIEAHEGRRLGALLDWMQAHIAENLPLGQLAGRAGMSLRTFQRRFEEMTGLSPGHWIIRERVNRAREALESGGEIPLETLAPHCGFGSAATLRHHFRRELGVTPTAYRARFSEVSDKAAARGSPVQAVAARNPGG